MAAGGRLLAPPRSSRQFPPTVDSLDTSFEISPLPVPQGGGGGGAGNESQGRIVKREENEREEGRKE